MLCQLYLNKTGRGRKSGKRKQLNLKQDVMNKVQIHPCQLQAARKYHRKTNLTYGKVSLLLLSKTDYYFDRDLGMSQ